jgi:hypothetical protein
LPTGIFVHQVNADRPPCFVVVALSCGAAGAADKTKVDRATTQVEQGAKQIGRGKVGPGFKEMFTGIGHRIVDGAKCSGNTMVSSSRRLSAADLPPSS